MHAVVVNPEGSFDESRISTLIVDDSANIRSTMTRTLTESGMRCTVVSDGHEALEELAHGLFDVVVTDIMMPRMNGHGLARYVLTMSSAPALVVVTGLVDADLARKLLAQGVDDILFKPVDYEVLAAKIEAIVRRRTTSCKGSQAKTLPTASESFDIPCDAYEMRLPAERQSGTEMTFDQYV